MTTEELISKAAACQDCGQEHRYRPLAGYRATWAAPDGHGYRPVLDVEIVAALRQLATGVYENPWIAA